MGDLNLEQIWSEFDKRDQVFLLGHLNEVADDSIQDIMW